VLVGRVAEQPLPAAEDHREHHEAQLVDEPVLEQALDELGTAVDDDLAVGLVSQPRDRLGQVALEHRRVVPLRVLQGRGDDVLRHLVEPVRELAVARRPRLGEPLVGPAAEQQRVRGHRLVELELVPLVAASDLEGPAAVLEVLRPARILHDPVERDELGHNDLPHGSLLSDCVLVTGRRTRRPLFDTPRWTNYGH
jgi:hypothetical protein